MATPKHHARKHSKYSASGAERWFNCQGSVKLSEGLPDKDNVWSIEGTKGHEVLETLTRSALESGETKIRHARFPKDVPIEMIKHGMNAGNFILDRATKKRGSEVLVETRIHLDFIHPEMFGTFDGAIIHHFGGLEVFDYKYGKSFVSAGGPLRPNYQMLFYGIGLAAKFDWNFKDVKLWIIQPRVAGYDGPTFWPMSIMELKAYVRVFEEAIERVERYPDRFVEGRWCHFCKAQTKCPLKETKKLEKAIDAFKANS